jgi:hypothetical protein
METTSTKGYREIYSFLKKENPLESSSGGS